MRHKLPSRWMVSRARCLSTEAAGAACSPPPCVSPPRCAKSGPAAMRKMAVMNNEPTARPSQNHLAGFVPAARLRLASERCCFPALATSLASSVSRSLRGPLPANKLWLRFERTCAQRGVRGENRGVSVPNILLAADSRLSRQVFDG
eukprot:scaffold64460_cov63-Phaeocystis_antarctica.AAC.3